MEQKYGVEVANMLMGAEADPDTEFVRETSKDFDTIPPVYINGPRLSCSLISGDTFTVGSDIASETALFISPHIEPGLGREGHSFGIYTWCDSNGLVYPDDLNTALPAAGKTYILLGRTFEHIGSADTLSWTHSNIVKGSTYSDFRVQFRIVDLSTAAIIGVCSCSIRWDGESFFLAELHSEDILDTKEFPAEQRAAFIQTALDFMTDSKKGVLQYATAKCDYEDMKERAVVQHSSKPYFKITLDGNGKYIRFESITFIHPIAVSIPSPVGPVTVYIAATQEYSYSKHSSAELQTMEQMEEPEYYAFGYDILCPMTEESLVLLPTLQAVSDKLQLKNMYS